MGKNKSIKPQAQPEKKKKMGYKERMEEEERQAKEEAARKEAQKNKVKFVIARHILSSDRSQLEEIQR